MPERQIFYDPQRKRWKRLRRILDIAAVLSTLVVVASSSISSRPAAAGVAAARCRGTITALCPTNRPAAQDQDPARRAPQDHRRPSDIPLNTGEGLRAAYYVQDDAASYTSLKEHVHQIDLLFPQWLHVDSPRAR